jgi:hypothetical protein
VGLAGGAALDYPSSTGPPQVLRARSESGNTWTASPATSGKWQARWREPGGRHRVKTFRLKADAERFLVGIEDSKHRGAYHDPNAGREMFGAFWEEERAMAARTGRLSERTLIAYDEIVRLYLKPLARRPLSSITRADVEDVVRGAGARGPDVHKVVRAILGRAVKAGKLAANPATGVDVRKPEYHEPRTLSGEELDRLVEAAMPDRYRASSDRRLLVAALVGTRRATRQPARPRSRRDPRRGEDRRVWSPHPGCAEDGAFA